MNISKFSSALTVVSVCVSLGISGCSLFGENDTAQSEQQVKLSNFKKCYLSYFSNLEGYRSYYKEKHLNSKYYFKKQEELDYQNYLKYINNPKVIEDCLPAALDNNAEAQFYLADAFNYHSMYINKYLNNDSIKSHKKNYKEIADNADSEYKKWLKLSADLGFAKAQGELAVIYRLDGLIDYNNGEYNKAVSEYNNALIYATKASSQNDVKGTYLLAWMYYHGEGVEQNKEKAYALLKKNYELGDAFSTWEFGMIRLKESVIEKNNNYYLEGISLLEKAAYSNADPETKPYYKRSLASLYRSGAPDLGIKKDIHKALYYYDLACKQGLGDACNLFERVLKEK